MMPIICFIVGVFGMRIAVETCGNPMLRGEEVARSNHTIPGTHKLY